MAPQEQIQDIPINFRVSSVLKERFERAVGTRGARMSEVLRAFMDSYASVTEALAAGIITSTSVKAKQNYGVDACGGKPDRTWKCMGLQTAGVTGCPTRCPHYDDCTLSTKPKALGNYFNGTICKETHSKASGLTGCPGGCPLEGQCSASTFLKDKAKKFDLPHLSTSAVDATESTGVMPVVYGLQGCTGLQAPAATTVPQSTESIQGQQPFSHMLDWHCAPGCYASVGPTGCNVPVGVTCPCAR